MKEYQLKYGCNPNQGNAKLYMSSGKDLPFTILNGNPGYINFLDALNGWQLVSELARALDYPAATSFKHVSPTSAAIGLPLNDSLKKACFVSDLSGPDLSPLACAYARARGADRLSSFGDFIALSEPCDLATAKLIRYQVSDGIIAPGYAPEALNLLKEKKNGKYNIIQIDSSYQPSALEAKEVFGITFMQERNNLEISLDSFSNIVTANKKLPPEAKRDLVVALICLKYTQSNSVAYAYDGQAIGIGAGQQSRIHCTRLAGAKADAWFLRQADKVLNLPFKEDLPTPTRDNVIDAYIHKNQEDCCQEGIWQRYFIKKPEPFSEEEKEAYLKEITGVSCGSDAFFPFPDNIVRAYQSGVSYIAQPGGSIRDQQVIEMCDKLGITMAFTGNRLFHH